MRQTRRLATRMCDTYTHALVVARAAEDVAEYRVSVVGQAEDRDTGEEREDPWRMNTA